MFQLVPALDHLHSSIFERSVFHIAGELSKVLADELMTSRQRNGQRDYVGMEPKGSPTEEPPADIGPDVRDVMGMDEPREAPSRELPMLRMPAIPEEEEEVLLEKLLLELQPVLSQN